MRRRNWLDRLAVIVSFAFLTVFVGPAHAQRLGPRILPMFRVLPNMAIRPNFFIQPNFRTLPVFSTMTGTAGSLQLFNVRAGVVGMPVFPNHFQHELVRREIMLNRLTNAYAAGLSSGAMMGSYGSYPSISSYGGGGGYGQMTSMPASSAYEPSLATSGLGAKTGDVSRILTAAGISNDKGEMSWPVGLQALFPATENKELLRQLNAGLQTAALQKSDGSIDAESLKGLTHAAARLRQMLQQREPYLQALTYREADRYLKNIENALTQIQSSATVSR